MLTKLRAIRKRRNLTQSELSAETGIHRVTIAKYEACKLDPTAEKIKKLAAALKVTADELMGEGEE